MSGPLRLYNTLTRSKEVFEPIDPKNVRLYVCGPTVYDYAHIGNARPVIVFDVLFRLLRHIYGEEHVVYARNITDVDDKINARAAQDFPGLPLNEAIAKVTEATEKQFHDDVAALGCLAPTHEPRATEHIGEMKALIERLVARGLAYVAEDNILFSPAAMDRLPGAPRYGSLARRSLDEMLAGARVDVAPYKRDPMDFVLWKPSKPGEPGWPSPCGIVPLGRPGWHIECSAMSMAKLLAPFGGGLSCDDPSKNIFDIHGGGVDLVFPHHENEIAQSCCAFGTPRMANYWMHNGFLQVEGEKMSKSLGNFVTINELRHDWPGEVIRFNMLRTHYRQPTDWTMKGLEESFDTYFNLLDTAEDYIPSAPDEAFLEALFDDLNTPQAIARVHELRTAAENGDIDSGAALIASLRLIGLGAEPRESGFVIPLFSQGGSKDDIFEALMALFPRNYPIGRAIGTLERSSLDTMNNEIAFVSDRLKLASRDLRAGDALRLNRAIEAINKKISDRLRARKTKQFHESDRVRDELAAMGVVLKDNKDGTTTWEVKR